MKIVVVDFCYGPEIQEEILERTLVALGLDKAKRHTICHRDNAKEALNHEIFLANHVLNKFDLVIAVGGKVAEIVDNLDLPHYVLPVPSSFIAERVLNECKQFIEDARAELETN